MRLAGGLLALVLSAVAASPGAAEGDAFRDTAAWLEQRIATLGDGGPGTGLRPLALAARDRLVQAGVDPQLAGSLVLPPGKEDVAAPAAVRHELRRAASRLREFAAAADRPVPAVAGDAAERVERILEDPVFASAAEGPGPVERQLRRLRELIAGAMQSMFDFVSTRGTLMVWITALAAVGALVFFIVRFVVPLLGARSYRAPAGFATPESLIEADLEPQEVLAAAREALEAGREVAAAKLLVQAAMLALRRRGVLPGRPGLTELESVALLRADGSPAGADFASLSEIHERLVYAGRSVGPDGLRRAVGLAARIVAGHGEQAA